MTKGGADDSRGSVTGDIDELRKLVLALLAGRGLRPAGEYVHQDGVDLIVETTILTATRRTALVRVCAGHASARTFADLRAAADNDGQADYILVARTADAAIAADDRVLCGERLDRALGEAWLITEPSRGSGHAVDREGLKLVGRLRAGQPSAFRDVLRAVLALSRNRVPAELAGEGTADDLFERYVFDILTGVLRLDGRRFGSAAKGKRVGDALIGSALCEKPVVVDCKAARAGYLMTVAEERKLVEYASADVTWGTYRGRAAGVLVVSSSFQGGRAAVNPYEARREALRKVGSDLWYLRVDDLAAAILAAPRDFWNDTELIRKADWAEVLGAGVVTRGGLISALQKAAR